MIKQLNYANCYYDNPDSPCEHLEQYVPYNSEKRYCSKYDKLLYTSYTDIPYRCEQCIADENTNQTKQMKKPTVSQIEFVKTQITKFHSESYEILNSVIDWIEKTNEQENLEDIYTVIWIDEDGNHQFKSLKETELATFVEDLCVELRHVTTKDKAYENVIICKGKPINYELVTKLTLKLPK